MCWLGLGLTAFSLLVLSCSVSAGLAELADSLLGKSSLLDVFSRKSHFFQSLAAISENILVYDRLHSTTTAHHRPGWIRQGNS